MQEPEYIDKPTSAREREKPDVDKLRLYLTGGLLQAGDELEISQFPGGYSNLTFLLTSGQKEYVLRKPPVGANIKSAHDMGREYRVLTALKPVYPSVPTPLLYCEDASVIGAPFYIMERVKGVILRNRPPKGLELTPERMKTLSEAAVDNLVALHNIDLEQTGLIQMGKPEGYVRRQVEGWIKRYKDAETDEVAEMDASAKWLLDHMPADDAPAFIHNDYKYDNLVLDPETLKIKAVLDWEMATVGSPLMDLGTSLAYWAEGGDSEALKPFNLTWLPGNLSRAEVLQRYSEKRGVDLSNFLFYYVFGSFKIGVIVQQIYARYKKGFTQDPRFAGLIHVVKALGRNGSKAIESGRIGS
jgi:aminoglycoside phosphotransferase (APT) family kinase protein